MSLWSWIPVLILLPVCACANDVYRIRPLSDGEMLKTYESMMLDACRQADGEWHVSPSDPKAGYWGDGLSDGNEGIRAVGDMVLASGALLKYARIPGADRKALREKAIAAIRYVSDGHKTGDRACADGKKWGASWQSAMWTATWAFGAWLMYDDLDPNLREDVERVVSFEADRLLNVTPPTGRWDDTKAEENGWDMTCLALAPNMFPTHPHAAQWRTKAIEYMMNTLSVPRDLADDTVVDGRPTREWVHGANLHPDFTLENHSRFHPSYVQCSSYFLTQAAMYHTYGGRPIPQAATHHLMDTWHMFETILLPWAETAFPQSIDWEQHGLPAINLFASLGTYMGDPVAAGAERTMLQYMRKWQEWCDGGLEAPGSPLGFTRHAIQAEQATYSYLAHKVFPSVPGAAREDARPPDEIVRNFSSIGVLLHRTPSKLFTFSWKYRMMGMLMPVGEGHLGKPFFTVPITNGFVGTFELSKGERTVEALDHRWRKTSDGFETTGTLLTNGGALRQAIRVTSLGDKVVVYQDRVMAESAVSVVRELGVPFGIENDQLSGGTRVMRYTGGEVTFDWQKPREAVTIPGNWANVDGRLGVVSVRGSGMTYVQAKGYTPQGVYADVLYGSYSAAPHDVKAGDEVARRVVIFLADSSPEETEALADSVRAEDGVLRFALPDGDVHLDLL